jgi:hypothetical protein
VSPRGTRDRDAAVAGPVREGRSSPWNFPGMYPEIKDDDLIH